MPDDDVERFTERSEQRRELFEDIAARLPTTALSPAVWAVFQVADLEQLTKRNVRKQVYLDCRV